MKLYDELSGWWRFVTAPEDYAEEAAIFRDAIDRLARRPVRRVLELGCGGGNNATHMKEHYELTLTDISEKILDVSRAQNPECTHVRGDMRTIRLRETFDAVFVHDAIIYMTTEDDLRAAMLTAREHLEPGGVALFVPDETAENYVPQTSWHGGDEPDRAMRYLQWTHPAEGTTYRCSFAVLMREGTGPVRMEFDEHVCGLFQRRTWLDLIASAGLEASVLPYAHSSFETPRDMFAGILGGP